MAEVMETDVLVVGAGGAGMRAAYEAHLAGARVLVAVKGRLGAVGIRGAGVTGVAISEMGAMRAVGLPHLRPGDRLEPDQVYEDAIQCGLGLADRKLIRILVDEAVPARRQLEDWGMTPTFAEGYGAKTHGVPITMALHSVIRRSDVQIRERTAVTDLLLKDGAVVGALAVDEQNGDVAAIKAASTVLATGGLGRLYALNMHPSCVTGDGYAMGYEAGAELLNMEFHQIIHGTIFPTVNLLHGWVWESYPRLTNAQGEEFLERYLPPGVTAKECLDQRRMHHPFSVRDAHSRYLDVAVTGEVKAGRGTPRKGVFVEITDRSYKIRPDLLEWYRYRGVQWDQGPVEIGICHNCCNGGLRMDEHGQTTVPGLFAVGETAMGPHGADRIGGHMLLQSQVFGARAGKQAAKRAAGLGPVSVDQEQVARLESSLVCPRQGLLPVAKLAEALGELIWRNLLVARTAAGLKATLAELARMREEDLPRLAIAEPLELARAVEVRNGLRAAELVARGALAREESRGGHHRADFPARDDARWLRAVSIKKANGQMSVDTSRVVDPEWQSRDSDMFDRRWG